MIKYLKLAAGIAIAAVLTFTHIYVYNAGKQSVLTRLTNDRIKVLKDGKEIDTEVLGADDTGLCALLGGCELPNNGDN